MELNIVLSDWGVASFTTRHLTSGIQPLLLRAPEVLVQTEWDTKVHIWNLGALVPELIFGQKKFCGNDKKGVYSVGTHLEEMAALYGGFPGNLYGRGDCHLDRGVL
jgi:serine/threonine-protein kinase SRPK3